MKKTFYYYYFASFHEVHWRCGASNLLEKASGVTCGLTRTTKTLTVFFSRLAGGGCCGVGTMMGGEGGYTVCPW